MTSNRRKGETYTGHELMRSSLTRRVERFISGAVIYSHNVPTMAGTHVLIMPSPDAPGCHDWETHYSLEEARSEARKHVARTAHRHAYVQGAVCKHCGLTPEDVLALSR